MSTTCNITTSGLFLRPSVTTAITNIAPITVYLTRHLTCLLNTVRLTTRMFPALQLRYTLQAVYVMLKSTRQCFHPMATHMVTHKEFCKHT